MVLLSDMELEEVVGGAVQALVGINSPKDPKLLTAPDSATSGLTMAFTNVIFKGPGDLSNIDLV